MKNKLILFLFLFSTQTTLAADVKAKQLWKAWYLFTVNGQVQGYYSEEVESRPKTAQLAISQTWMEHDDGLTQTYIGSVAKNDADFSPVAFYVERKKSNSSTNIDGRIKDGQILIQSKSGSDLQKMSLKPEKGLIWANFLGLLLAKNKGKQSPIFFSAVIEDAKDGSYDPQVGKANATSEHKKIHNENCGKFTLNYQNIQSEWWVADNGKVCEVYIPSSESRISLSSEKETLAAFQPATK